VISLRPYQETAVERIRAEIRAGNKRVCCVAPTGAGKTVIFSALINRTIAKGEPVLVCAHRRELITQTVDKVLKSNVDPLNVNVVMGTHRQNHGALVSVASVDTLRNRAKPRARVVIFDECHRAMADTYRAIADSYPDAIHLGFTATPWRLDGQGLNEIYRSLVVVETIPSLITQGFLVPVDCYSHPRKPTAKLKVRGGEYVLEEAQEAMMDRILLGDLVEHYRMHGNDGRAFYFACGVDHSKAIVKTFLDAGIPAAHVDGSTPDDERDSALRRLRSGELRVLSNVNVFTEGTDVPQVEVIGIARPTKSKALAMQIVGRGMRPSPETGKRRCVVLDHAGVVQAHGHPCDEQSYSLEGLPKRSKSAPAPTKTCPRCQREVSAATITCDCGHSWTRDDSVSRAEITTIEGKLVEVKPRVQLTPEQIEAAYQRAYQQAVDAGAAVPTAYAAKVFASRTGQVPPKAVVERISSRPHIPRPRTPLPTWLQQTLSGSMPPPGEPPAAPPPTAPPASSGDAEWIEL
jgi:superfamily II DNA or RNA helicase